MFDPELVREILSQILEAISRIDRRFSAISAPDDFLVTDEGVDKLDAICMMLIALGESLKNLDKVTDGKLLSHYPHIDWKGAKGIRDIISHHYFNMNADVIFHVCEEKMPGLKAAIEAMQESLGTGEIP